MHPRVHAIKLAMRDGFCLLHEPCTKDPTCMVMPRAWLVKQWRWWWDDDPAPSPRKPTQTPRFVFPLVMEYRCVREEGREWDVGRAVCWSDPPHTLPDGTDIGCEGGFYLEARGFVKLVQ